jgi:hypothetical protein
MVGGIFAGWNNATSYATCDVSPLTSVIVSKTSYTDYFVNVANDYHLKSTATDFIDAGTSSVDSFFTDDIDGVTRSGTWDIGADEYVAAAATSYIVTSKTRQYRDTKPPPGSMLNFGHPLSQGLVGCWLMNEGGGSKVINLATNISSSFANSSGFNFSWKQSLKGMSLETLRANKSYIPVGSINVRFISIVAYCPEIEAGNGQDTIIMCKDYNGANVPYCLNIGAVTGATAGMGFYDGGWRISGLNTELRGYRDKFVVGTYDGITLKFYINAKLDASANYTATSLPQNTQQTDIGRYASDSANGWFGGKLSYVYLYSRALTPSEIQSLYEAPYQIILPQRRRFILTTAEAGGEVVNVTVSVASALALTLAVQAPTEKYDYVLNTVATQALTLAIQAPVAKFDYVVNIASALTSTLALIAPEAGTQISTTISVSAQTLTLSLQVPLAKYDFNIPIGSALELTLALQNPTYFSGLVTNIASALALLLVQPQENIKMSSVHSLASALALALAQYAPTIDNGEVVSYYYPTESLPKVVRRTTKNRIVKPGVGTKIQKFKI